MISWNAYLICAAFAYALILFMVSICCSHKLRKCLHSLFNGEPVEIYSREYAIMSEIRGKIKKSDREQECPICMEEMKSKAVYAICNHVYCSACII